MCLHGAPTGKMEACTRGGPRSRRPRNASPGNARGSMIKIAATCGEAWRQTSIRIVPVQTTRPNPHTSAYRYGLAGNAITFSPLLVDEMRIACIVLIWAMRRSSRVPAGRCGRCGLRSPVVKGAKREQ